jgi:hypothetical protein
LRSKRKTFLIALATAACLIAGNSFARGKSSDGGGSDDPPSAQEIRRAVNHLAANFGQGEWRFVPMKLYLDMDGPTIDQKIGKPLHDLLEKIDEDGERRATIAVRFEEHGPCHGIDGDQEASAPLCRKDEPVCFSIPMIRARVPRVTLEESMIPLLMHEVAHQNCANEAMAKQVEHFYSSTVMKHSGQTFDLQYQAQMLVVYLVGERDELKTGAMGETDNDLCLNLGKIEVYKEGLIFGSAAAVRRAQSQDQLSARFNRASAILDNSVDQASYFCNDHIGKGMPGAVNPGDRAALLKVIEAEIGAYRELADEVRLSTRILFQSID